MDQITSSMQQMAVTPPVPVTEINYIGQQLPANFIAELNSQYWPNIEILRLVNCNLTQFELNARSFPRLRVINLEFNKLTTLNLNGFEQKLFVYCSDNPFLTHLYTGVVNTVIAERTALTQISIQANNYTSCIFENLNSTQVTVDIKATDRTKSQGLTAVKVSTISPTAPINIQISKQFDHMGEFTVRPAQILNLIALISQFKYLGTVSFDLTYVPTPINFYALVPLPTTTIIYNLNLQCSAQPQQISLKHIPGVEKVSLIAYQIEIFYGPNNPSTLYVTSIDSNGGYVILNLTGQFKPFELEAEAITVNINQSNSVPFTYTRNYSRAIPTVEIAPI